MKKLIIFAILFIGMRVHYNGHKLSFQAGQTAYADDWGEEDPPPNDPPPDNPPPDDPPSDPGDPPSNDPPSDPSYGEHHLETDGLPAEGITSKQATMGMCGETNMSLMATYLGVSISQGDILTEFASEAGVPEYNAAFSGITPGQMYTLADHYFNNEHITASGISGKIDEGWAVLAYIPVGVPHLEFGEMTQDAHAAFITGYNDDGSYNYIDTESGLYATTSTVYNPIACSGVK